MFIGRTKELAELERRYAQPGFQFPVIYGRRRIGKTRLIQEFLRGKRAVYFMAAEQSNRELLTGLTQAIKEQLPDEHTKYLASFDSWEACFSYLAELAGRGGRLVLAIDEYPYLAKANPSISSLLQKAIDGRWRDTELYLILCGSSMSFMEHQVLGEKSPLYGRRTGQLKLAPFPYYEGIRFFPGWPKEEQLMGFGICGGIPKYLELFAQYASLREAVLGEFLLPSGHLIEEPENLMKQELREPAFYNSILAAIAGGATRLNEIAQAVGTESSKLGFYLGNLRELGLVAQEKPVGKGGSRHGVYRIADEMFAFWFRFLPSCRNLIAMGAAERTYDERIAPRLDEWFGHVFERICMEYLKFQVAHGTIQELYADYGRWWGTNPLKKQEEEINLVLSDETHLLVGECKWKNDRIGAAVFHQLEERAALIRDGKTLRYVLFSKAGFTDDLKGLVRNDLMLVDLDALFRLDDAMGNHI